MNYDNIKKAIEIGVCYVKPGRRNNTVRCFDSKMGYGKFMDLTEEEYAMYLEVSTLSKDEMLKRLENESNKIQSLASDS